MIAPGCFFILIYPVVMYFGLQSYQSAQQRAALYHKAVPCPAGSESSTSCYTIEPMTITHKSYGTRRGTPSDFFLKVSDSKGYENEEVPSGFWNSVKAGESVSAKKWSGMIVTLSSNDQSVDTWASPDHVVSFKRSGLAWATVFPAIGVLCLIVAIRRKLASRV